jgi:parallel beta-helix repeat protein
MRMRKRIFSSILVFILVVASFTCFKTQAETSSQSVDTLSSLEFTFSFLKPDVHEIVVHDTHYSTITIPGCMSSGKNPGEPALPVKCITLLLPAATKVKNIRVFGESQEIKTPINLVDTPVIPYQNPVSIGSEPPSQLTFDRTLYTSQEKYPSAVLGGQNIGYSRGYTLLSLSLYPIQYIPGQGKIFYYPELNVTVELEENNSVNQFFRNTQEDKEWVQKLVNNPELTETYTSLSLPTLGYTGGLCDSSNAYDYVIITTTQNGLDHWVTNATTPHNWTSLMHEHQTDDGLNCTLVTIQAINACSDYWNTTPLFNDTAAHIREFCRDAYQDWGTKYVLIGGDGEWIPARLMDTADEKDIDADIYWSNLDNTFNADHDTYWGEEGDNGFDLYSELYIGRLTCDTPQDVSNWMTKSFYYANSTDDTYLDNAGFYAGDSTWLCQGDDFIDYSAIKGTNDWLGPQPHYDGVFPPWAGFQYGFETWNTVNPGMMFNLSVKWTAEHPNAGWHGGSQTVAVNGLKTAINNNQVTLLSGLAHADATMSLDVYSSSWENDYHNTKPFFIHDYGCHDGDFDAADDGVLDSMLFHSNITLAFACVYNTCYGWGNGYCTNSSSSFQQKAFWDYFFDVENNSGDLSNWQLGKAQAWSKDIMAPTINWDYSYGSWRAIIQGCLLFGDPAQRIKPPQTHNIGVQTLQVDASNPAQPNTIHTVHTTVYNSGATNETNVSVSFRVNDIEINSTTISSLNRYAVQDINFSWTPSAGMYNVTINVTIPNVREATYSDNEKNQTVFVGVKNIDTDELFNTIQDAIDDTDTIDGHTILIPCGIYDEHVVINKNLSLEGMERNTTIVNGSAERVIRIQNKSSVNVSNLTLRNGTYGIYIESSSNTTITDNTICNNTIGICLNVSNNNTVVGNTIIDNNNSGIDVSYSFHNHVYNNTINNSSIGIKLFSSLQNDITGDMIKDEDFGISFMNSSYNKVCMNNISANDFGINLSCSSNNTINKNTIIDNNEGIYVESSSENNSIFYNNFISNTQNAYDESHNTWYNTTLFNGNYWEDYIGYDMNHDGIGDSPYNISGGTNNDSYPLVFRFDNYFLLTITASSQVNEETIFTITVKTVGGTIIHNASVNCFGNNYLTDSEGRVNVTAPSVNSDTLYTITATKTGYAEASVTITVKNVESDGYQGSSGGGEDLTGPTAPSNVRVTTPENNTTPSFHWTAATDSSGIAGYYIRIDNGTDTWIGNVLEWTSTNTTINGNHTFFVKAKDASANGNQGKYGSCWFIINSTTIQNLPLAKTNGPYHGLTFQNINFDGSTSTDADGIITNYTWDFGDTTIEYGIIVSHRYITRGIFNITLTVRDNDGLTNISRTMATIILDSDADGFSDTLEKQLGSNPSNALDVKTITIAGASMYLIDTNGDGTFEIFYNSVTGDRTVLQPQIDGTYLIDANGDGTWEYVYNPVAGKIMPYTKEQSPALPILAIIITIIILVIILIVMLFKTGRLPFHKK